MNLVCIDRAIGLRSAIGAIGDRAIGGHLRSRFCFSGPRKQDVGKKSAFWRHQVSGSQGCPARSDCDRLRSEAFEISRVWLLGYQRYQLREVLENKVSQVSDMAMKPICFTALGEPRWGHAR